MTPHARAEIQELLRRLADGDRAAIRPSFETLWPVLRSFSARALGSDADAEDAAQQALVKLFAQISDLDPERDAMAWAFTITAFECRTVRRRTERRREMPDLGLEQITAAGQSPEEAVLQRDLEVAAHEVLRGLRDEDVRAIVAAINAERPDHGATFRKRLQRALDRLRLAWRAKHDTR